MQDRTRLLDTPDAAEYLGLEVPTLTHWRSKGIGPRYVKLGRGRSADEPDRSRVRYRLADLDEWIEENLVTPTGVRGDAAYRDLHKRKGINVRGMRICVECGEKAWADAEQNWSAANEAAGGSLSNPGRDAYLSALEMREIEPGSVLCGTCVADVVGLAWSIRQREEREESAA